MGNKMAVRFLKPLFLVFALVGCTRSCSPRKDMTAEQVVEAYLNIALNMEKVEQKSLLLEYATGPLRDAIAGATDETIKTAYIDRRYQLKRFSLVSRKDHTPRETEVTYHLIYNELPEGSTDETRAVSVSTENTVELVREDSLWYIQNVIGSKTSFDFPVARVTPE